MNNLDSAVADERAYQIKLERLEAEYEQAQERAMGELEKGYPYDPFSYGNMSDFFNDHPTFAEEFGEMLRAKRYAEGAEQLTRRMIEWNLEHATQIILDKGVLL